MRRLSALLLITAVAVLPARQAPAQAPAAGGPPIAAAPAEGSPRPAADGATLALQRDLDQLVATSGLRGSQWGVMVVSIDQGDTLYAHQPDQLLVPASNMKLFTSAAALYYLGPDFRFNTFLLATGPIENGVLEGDLVLYGTGDPTLSDRFGTKLSVWRAFADTLRALGVREVRGSVVGDGSYFAGPAVGAGWKPDYMNAAYAAPSGALSYAENIATLEIRPGAAAGQKPQVRLVPGGTGMAFVNDATTVASGRSVIHVTRASYDGPIVVRGQIARNSGAILRTIPVSDPAWYAAAALREVLEGNGVRVHGGAASVLTPAQSPVTGRSVFAPAFDATRPLRVLALHNSPPLISILEIVNKRSHNLMAEQALRTVARVATGEGSVDGGARAVMHLMNAASPQSTQALDIMDGSGLSPLNRVTARSIIQLLAFMAGTPMWESYWQTLPEAGAPGGLRRMHQTRAQNNLRAKTGTIENVSALSGYVRAANGERLAFAIMSNYVASTWRAKRIEDAIGARLAEFSRGGEYAVPDPSDSIRPPARTEPRPSQARQPAAGRTHTIRKGDTLDAIARRYGVTVAALRQANGNVAPNRLIPGRTLRIP